MSLLSKVRGLWRFDGDTEPIKVSRRRFIFLGAVAAAGAAIPWAPGTLALGERAASFTGVPLGLWPVTLDESMRNARIDLAFLAELQKHPGKLVDWSRRNPSLLETAPYDDDLLITP